MRIVAVVVCGLCVLCALALLSSRVSAQPASHQFDATGVTGCPSSEEFWKRLAVPLDHSGSASPLRVEFENDARGVRGHLVVERPGEPPLERRVLAPTCVEAADALGIVIEQMSSTGFRELSVAAPEPAATRPATAQPATPEPATTQPAAAQSEAREPGGTQPAATRPEAATVGDVDVATISLGQRSEPETEASFRLGASARGALPGGQPVGAFAAITMSWGDSALAPELALRARWHPLESLSAAGGVVDFRWWAGELAPNLRLARLTSSLELRAGAALSVGRLTSAGSDLTSARTAHSLWISLAPEIELRQTLGRRWLLALAVAGEVPLVGADVRVDGHGTVFSSPFLGLASDLAIGVRF